MKRLVLIVSLFAVGLAPLTAHAENEFEIQCTRIIRKLILPGIIPKPQGKTFQVTDISDLDHPVPVTVKVGARLGIGMKGAVYRIDEIHVTDPELLKKYPSLQHYGENHKHLVAKVSHQGRLTGFFLKRFQNVLIDEYNVYKGLAKAAPAIEADPEFEHVFDKKMPNGKVIPGSRRGPSWEPGTFPVATIYADSMTPFGHVIVKDEIDPKKALDLEGVARLVQKRMWARVAREQKNHPGLSKPEPQIELEDIPLNMQQSLREAYRTSQIASKHTTYELVEGGEKQLTETDINPDNLMWVSDRKQRKLFHLTRPGFVAPELGEPALTHYVRQDLLNGRKFDHNSATEDEYLATWVKYLRKAAQSKAKGE